MKDNLVLLLFVTLLVGINALDSSGKGLQPSSHVNRASRSKFEDLIGSKSVGNDAAGSAQGPFCQSIVAYYVGTLKNKKSSNTVDVQFQLKLWANQKTKHIHVKADKWNEKVSKSSDAELDFYYEGNRQWCDIYDDDCSASFAKKDTSFKLDLNTADGNSFHLLNFNVFNNSFGLVKPKGQCTKHQLDDLNDDNSPDLEQLSYCVCCDDYSPSDLLGCPNDKWAHESSTPSPSPPPKKDASCKSVVGYYNGTFQNSYNRNIKVPIEFQVRLEANDNTRRIKYYIDRWNEGASKSSDERISVYDGNTDNFCTSINSSSCSIPYVSRVASDFHVTLDHYPNGSWDNYFNFAYFLNFNNTFVLTDAIGQCTRSETYDKSNSFDPDQSLYNYCLCCGNYNPHPSLGCPKNPWA